MELTQLQHTVGEWCGFIGLRVVRWGGTEDAIFMEMVLRDDVPLTPFSARGEVGRFLVFFCLFP